MSESPLIRYPSLSISLSIIMLQYRFLCCFCSVFCWIFLAVWSAGAAGDIRSSAWFVWGPSSLHFFSENPLVHFCSISSSIIFHNVLFVIIHLPVWYFYICLEIIQSGLHKRQSCDRWPEWSMEGIMGFPSFQRFSSPFLPQASWMLEAAMEPGTPCRNPWLWIWRLLLPAFGVQTSCNSKLRKWRWRRLALERSGQNINHDIWHQISYILVSYILYCTILYQTMYHLGKPGAVGWFRSLKVAKTALMAGVVRNTLASRSFKFWTWDYFASLPELQSASECRLQSHWRCKYGPRKCLALRRSLVGSCRVQISHRTSSDIVQRLLDKGIDKLSTARVAIGSTRWRENTMKTQWHDTPWHEAKKTEKKRIEVPSL